VLSSLHASGGELEVVYDTVVEVPVGSLLVGRPRAAAGALLQGAPASAQPSGLAGAGEGVRACASVVEVVSDSGSGGTDSDCSSGSDSSAVSLLTRLRLRGVAAPPR
jgi:hypothetical protein